MPDNDPSHCPDWITESEVLRRLRVCPQTLWNWRTKSCPYLDGERLSIRRERRNGERSPLYLRAHIEQIGRAERRPQDNGRYSDQDGVWLSIEAATERYGFERGCLETWARKGCTLLGRKPITRQEARRDPSGKGGRVRFLVFLKKDLQRIAAIRKAGGRKNSASWITAAEAKVRFTFGRPQLQAWADEGCPFLDKGESLRTSECVVLQKDGRARRVRTFSLGQLERISAARGAADADWLSWRQGRELFGFSRQQPYQWHKYGCAYLAGKRLRAKPGAARGELLYHLPQLKLIASLLGLAKSGVHEDRDGVWLSARTAKKRYGVWGASLEDWREQGTVFLGGRPLRAKRITRLTAGKERRESWVYLEEDIKQIIAERKKEAVYQDAEGTWLFACEVEKRYGLPADNLWYHRNKTYPSIPSGKLRVQTVPGDRHPRPHGANLCHVYHEDDIRTVVSGVLAEAIAESGGLGAPPPRRHAGGRPRSKDTEEKYRLCFEGVMRGEKRSRTMDNANRHFGEEVVAREEHVLHYAKRHAERHGLGEMLRKQLAQAAAGSPLAPVQARR
jgi:hypothetical protein